MFKWERWIKNKEECQKAFEEYLEKETISKEEEKENLSQSHLQKVDHNIDFINNLLNQKKFYDWVIVGCYYTIYHASLALLTIKGYSSKTHLSTLCALIHLYYKDSKNNNLNKQDIELIAKSSLDKQEVTYFVEAKDKRKTASYGISKEFNKIEAKNLKIKTILFTNKVKEILENL